MLYTTRRLDSSKKENPAFIKKTGLNEDEIESFRTLIL